MTIKGEIKDKILSASDGRLQDVIIKNANVARRGQSYRGTCPSCGGDNFEFTPKKEIFKCYNCEFAGNSPISFWMKQGKKYPEALAELAEQFGININDDEPKRVINKKSYCSRMLADSGLTAADVQSKVFIKDTNKTSIVSPTFRQGTLNSRNEQIQGDDVIIEYFDLEGNPVMYEINNKQRTSVTTKEYFRVRWQYPEEHKDKNGKPYKYKSPSGSGSFIFIPQKIRDIYKSGQKIDTLFIQEGEKKAEKACKHGIPSVAISGIHNLGRNGVLHEDLVKLIIACDVKNLILIFDSDWQNLSSNIGINDFADQRPRSFFTAAKNFKEYTIQLRNSRNIYLEIFIGNVKISDLNKSDKGIDDILANTLKDKEDVLATELISLLNEREKRGKYIDLYKITTWSDAKILDLWSLANAADFAERHKAVLKDLPEFRIGKYRWRYNEKGVIESAQPLEVDEQYWSEEQRNRKDGSSYTMYSFRYERCFRFLQNRGFGRFHKPDGGFSYIRINHPFVETIEQHEEIRDFVKDFTREIANEEVLEMLHRGGPQFLGPEKLSNLEFKTPNMETPRRDRQLLYFKDCYWDIREDSIIEGKYSSIAHQLWQEQVQDITVKRTEPLMNITKNDNDTFSYTLSNTGNNCHFLRFLENTSNFTWRKEQKSQDGENYEITDEEKQENITHFVSKICAIGFMVMSSKDKSVAKAVVAMDGKQSEVGESNGRSGKSLLGELFKEIEPTVYVNGKYKEIESDPFIWEEVDERTRCVFIDDVRVNFNLEFIFPNIANNWNINKKGVGRYTIPFSQSPKLYITTNHGLNGEGFSFADRQWRIAFSDYYNDTHKPVHDFGVLFFDEWDFEQWNLTWNMLAECVQYYLRFGVVEAPGERIKQRQLRQAIGEAFIAWADEYYSDPDKLNVQIRRKEMSDSYGDYAPEQRKYTTAHGFKSKLRKYCEWKGLLFNPHMYDSVSGICLKYDKDGKSVDTDKSGGIEYFMVGDPETFKAVAARMQINNNDLPFMPSDEEKPF